MLLVCQTYNKIESAIVNGITNWKRVHKKSMSMPHSVGISQKTKPKRLWYEADLMNAVVKVSWAHVTL
jgi:hypothetical protein